MNAFSPRRKTEPQISEAITLGWRIATLYSLRADELPSSPPDNLLPMRRSLPAAERLVLELRAAAGDAGRVELALESAELDELVRLAEQAPGDPAVEATFRDRIRDWHIDLQTMLWAGHEASGKAYELGGCLADTSNRVMLELRRDRDPCLHVTQELREVFSPCRVERIARLLDDLQSRIDPAAVRIVKDHLARWQEAVADRTADCFTREDLEPLNSQTITWFQLVTGDKEPEAYIDHEDRARVRGTMLSRTLRSYACNWRCMLVAAGALAGLVALAILIPLLDRTIGTQALVSIGGPIVGALGVSLTSIGRTVRTSLDARAELLWNTALVEVISLKTLRVNDLLRPPAPGAGWRPSAEPVRSAARVQAGRAA